MTCLNERIVGAIFLMLSGSAFADGFAINSSEAMTVANVAPFPMEVVPSIPDPQRYLQHYEMQYQASHVDPFYPQTDSFYSAQVTHDFRLSSGNAPGSDRVVAQQGSSYLRLGPSTAAQLSLIDQPDATFTLGAQPQRRLSLTVDTWVFSATARVAILHSHSTGATVSVRHGF